ncbi:MAG: hypothetical protein QW087_07680 [Methanomassiliicoccales archaeon]
MLNVPLGEQLLNASPLIIFLCISLVGMLHFANEFSKYEQNFVLIAGLLMLLVFGFSFFSIIFPLEHRWLVVSQLVLCIPFSFAIITLSRKKSPVTAIVVALIAFMMITNPQGSMEDNIYSPNTKVTYSFTEAEIIAIKASELMIQGKIGSDELYSYYAKMVEENSNFLSISQMLEIGKFENKVNFLLIRRYISEYPCRVNSVVKKLNYDVDQVLISLGSNKIYSCQTVNAYLR